MQGIIYLVTNNTEDLCYIGQTIKTIEQRWKDHIKDSKRFPNRPLYEAINRIGENNFEIEVLEVCPEELLDSKESYYIKFFDSRISGYNRNIGGQSRKTYLDSYIIEEYLTLNSVNKTAEKLDVNRATISRAINRSKINGTKKRIRLVKYNKTFASIADAARWLINNNHTKGSFKSAQTGISKVLMGVRQTYLKSDIEIV